MSTTDTDTDTASYDTHYLAVLTTDVELGPQAAGATIAALSRFLPG